MKRKLIVNDGNDEIPLVKSLRRSVTNFIDLDQKFSPEFRVCDDRIDETNISWKKYRQRLSTFTIKVRATKPKELSPINCSRHGWKFIGDDFLQCDDCGSIMCFTIPSNDVSINVFNLCIRNIQRKFTEAHSVACPWRTSNGLNVASCYDIYERYKSLAAGSLKPVPLKEEFTKEILFEKLDGEDRFALALAVCGWINSTRNLDSDCLECPICDRVLNYSIFNDEMALDPLEQHHFYCPVIDKNFPIWKESILSLPRPREHEPPTKSLWSVKSMVKNLFKM